jgi:hypothetical protein
MAALSVLERDHAIAAILEARFSLSAFEKSRMEDAGYWISDRNAMARGIYAEAMREKERLAGAPDSMILAETAAIRAAPAA